MIFNIKKRVALPMSRVSFPLLDGWELLFEGAAISPDPIHFFGVRNCIMAVLHPNPSSMDGAVVAGVYESPIDRVLSDEKIISNRIQGEKDRSLDSYRELERGTYLVCDEKATLLSYKCFSSGAWVVNYHWIWVDRKSVSELGLLLSCRLDDIARLEPMIKNFSALLKKE